MRGCAVLRGSDGEAADLGEKVGGDGDPRQAQRTWVPLTEAAEGGWGVDGTAFGREELVALLAPRWAARSAPSEAAPTLRSAGPAAGVRYFWG